MATTSIGDIAGEQLGQLRKKAELASKKSKTEAAPIVEEEAVEEEAVEEAEDNGGENDES